MPSPVSLEERLRDTYDFYDLSDVGVDRDNLSVPKAYI
jgi:hypothetical protein